jgi:transposase-like protein
VISVINKRPRTLMAAMAYFSDADTCEQYLASIRWPDHQPICPKCGKANAVKLQTRNVYQCKERGCRRQFRLKAGTIFEDSPLPLQKWFVAGWMLATCRNGISSYELARTIGVKQLSAWHMLHRLREVIKPGGNRKLCGVVESDESFVGGLLKNMHRHKRRHIKRTNIVWGNQYGANRTIVHAFLERGGEVRARVIPRIVHSEMQAHARKHIEPGTNIYTDAHQVYKGLEKDFEHQWVSHMYEYVRGNVHTNGLECFFSCLRRTIRGTYVAVDPEHLEAYCDEQAYRYTYRKDGEWERFDRLMHRVVGKRLMYSELTDGCKR